MDDAFQHMNLPSAVAFFFFNSKTIFCFFLSVLL